VEKRLAILGGEPVRGDKPWPAWPVFDESDASAVADAVRSGAWWRVEGTRVAGFERALADYCGAEYCLAVNSGTVALELAIQAAGVQPGDEIIVPPYTFMATASAVVRSNCVPVFADIDPDTYNLSAESAEAAVSDRTRGLIPVHLGGQPVDMDAFYRLAELEKLWIIEDAAHAHGAEWRGRRCGSLGHAGCLSFQASKNLTCGEGGAVLTSSEALYKTAFSLHHCGRGEEGPWYGHIRTGTNARMTELEAALLLSQLPRLEEQSALRDRNGRYLNDALGAIDGIEPLRRDVGETRHGYHLYIFRFRPAEPYGVSRDLFCRAVSAEGVPCSGGYAEPLYRQPMFELMDFGPYDGWRRRRPDLSYADVHCPNCEAACAEAVWLSQSMLLGDEGDMDDVVRAVAKVMGNLGQLRGADIE